MEKTQSLTKKCSKCGETLVCEKELCYGCREKELMDTVKYLEKTIDYYRERENQYHEKYLKYKNAYETLLETLIKLKFMG